MATYGEISGGRLSRRALLRLTQAAGMGVLGAALERMRPGQRRHQRLRRRPTPAAPAQTSTAPAPAAAQPPPATAAPAQVAAASSAAWDQLVAAGQKEGKVVVSGPPAPDTRSQLPAAFKQRFNIDMEYLAGNSSQLASRIESERAAGQYTMDASLGGPDTVYGRSCATTGSIRSSRSLMLPEVVDPKVWPTGRTVVPRPGRRHEPADLQHHQPDRLHQHAPRRGRATQDQRRSAGSQMEGQDRLVRPERQRRRPDLRLRDLRDPRRGLRQAALPGPGVAYTRDYQQIADWVAHDSYPIGIGATPVYIAPYGGACPLQRLVLRTSRPIVAGGFALSRSGIRRRTRMPPKSS